MITPTKVEPTSSDTHIGGVASGVWSVQDQLEARRGGLWPDASVANPDTLIENNFSTFVYTGNGSTRTITNGIDLSNKGGLVWTKCRSDSVGHELVDTVRGAEKYLESHSTNAEQSSTGVVNGFTSSGYTMLGTGGGVNDNNKTYVSWTFKKAPKFFDIVTWTGDGTDNREISHNLGSTPGMIMMKRTNASENWYVGCVAGVTHSNGWKLNETDAVSTYGYFGTTAPNASKFHVANFNGANANGSTYVAYVFGHETGSDSIIQCGKLSGNGNDSREIDLGWESQFIMLKRADSSSGGNWFVFDNMRGLVAGGADPYIRWNLSNAEDSDQNYVEPTATGFRIGNAGSSDGSYFNQSGREYIYMAIRGPNMATITDATEVFGMDTRGSTGDGNEPAYRSTFPVDFAINKVKNSATNWTAKTRLIQGKDLTPNTTGAEQTASYNQFDYMNGHFARTNTDSNEQSWMWKRAKGYFDVIAYVGNATSGNTKSHNLGVAPEMMWVKNREASNRNWRVYHSSLGATKYVNLNTNDGEGTNSTMWNDTAPSSTVITLGSNNDVNSATEGIIAYLFATLAGVSKVGGFTHTSGSSTDVDCGFTSGARFVLYKRYKEDGSAAAGNWRLFDTTRGIVSGNEAPLHLDDDTAESSLSGSDLIDPLSSGFQIASGENAGNYLFYAIA